MSRAAYNSIIKRELVYTRNNIVWKAKNQQVFIGCHSFLAEFIILENVNEFVDKGLAEIGDDKIIFNMPRAEKRLSKLTTEQQNLMSPILKISDKDKAKGIIHPYQKIKEFYKDCLNLGEEYKQDLEVPSIRKWNSRSPRLVFMCSKVLSRRNHIGYALEVYDGKPANERVKEPVSEPPPVKQTNKRAAATPNKRKNKAEESPDMEDDSVHEEDDNSSDSEANDFAEKKNKRSGKSSKEGGAAPANKGRGKPRKA
ncbi:hypothetical protein Tco_1011491 [Tanacetum coccineum]